MISAIAKISLLAATFLILTSNDGNTAQAANTLDIKFNEFFNPIIDRFLSEAVNQSLANENGTRREFRDYLLDDESNENIGTASLEQIIRRSGYLAEIHKVVSADGYITQLVRIINPLADRKHLKQPPVVLLHGGIIDPTCWVWSSAIQHHPERYPRSIGDGPMTSWNRSLAFTLANNGHDVWLLAMRGFNKQNQGHVKYKTSRDGLIGEELLAVELDRIKYWQFTLDDIVEHELPRQIDKVLEVSGANKVNIVAISVGVSSTLHLFATNKRYVKKTHIYVAMGPPITNEDSNKFLGFFQKNVCVNAPNVGGTLFFTELFTSQLVRDLTQHLAKIRRLRYSLVWAITLPLVGPSPTYQTVLEPSVIGHVLQPTCFKLMKQFCQNLNTGKLQKFDYGSAQKNFKHYGSSAPKAYEWSEISMPKNWVVVAGSNDVIGTQLSVRKLLNEVKPTPKLINIVGYNHVDLVAAMDNDVAVNLPLLKYFDRFQL